ncbi:hypothetical protein [Telmatospirillum sp.]|uniref:hypothetical protein n=1 Tax=Telmatospirillum sp. TaxID=2079197 RepID=UPI002847AF24|nr:hypothetical protein [Telmatospirillum sp.]MDR3435840.1 hypothetical protein [Telmatospirillum sp.]
MEKFRDIGGNVRLAPVPDIAGRNDDMPGSAQSCPPIPCANKNSARNFCTGYARKVRVANGEYTMDHSAVVYLMDCDGKFLRASNLERPPEQAAAELKPLL